MPGQFNDLPLEILHLILDLINPKEYATLRSVNTRWNSVLSPHVFNSVTIFNYFRRQRTVNSILDDMENSFTEMTAGKHIFRIPIGHHIQQLTLLNDDTSGDQLQRIPTLCPNITSFTSSSKVMENISQEEELPPLEYQQYHEQDLSTLDDQATPRVLLVDFFTALDRSGLTKLKLEETGSYSMLKRTILQSLSHLVELDIGSVIWELEYDFAEHSVADPFVDTLSLMDLIQDSCPGLEKLSMAKRSLSLAEEDPEITTLDGLAGWVHLIRVWPRLTSLRLNLNITQRCSRCWLVPTLMYLATRLPDLQQLHISAKGGRYSWKCSVLSNDERLANLMWAGLLDSPSSSGDGGNRERPYIFDGLQSITLEGICLNFLERMILFGYDELVPELHMAPTIQSIELSSNDIMFEESNDISLASQVTFLRYCISFNPLTSLTLSHRDGFNIRHLLDSLDHDTNQLETLCLYQWESIYIKSILDRCPHLQHLQLNKCEILGSTPTDIPSTSQSINDHQQYPLKTLNLNSSRIKDIGIFSYISQRYRQLSVLHLIDISIFDITPPSTTAATTKGKHQKPKHNKKPEKFGSLISLPYTMLTLCTLGTSASYCRHRFSTRMINTLLLPVTTAKIGHGPASLWHTTGKGGLLFEMISPGKCLQKVLYKMTSLGDDGDGGGDKNGDSDGGDGGDSDIGDDSELGLADEQILRQIRRDGLLAIRCKNIQELVIDQQTFYGPFGTP